MAITLKDIIGLAKELPEECFQETVEMLKEIKEKAKTEKAPAACPRGAVHSPDKKSLR